MSALDEALNTCRDPYYQITVKQLDAARAELAALRTQAALLDDYAETIRAHEITIAEQARQLEAARELLTALEWNDWDERVDAWLAANAPAPQQDDAQP